MKNFSLIKPAVAAAFVISSLSLSIPAAHAVPLIFFGEDQGAGGSLPLPNSIAAETAFLSNLVGVQTEDFEGLTSGATFPINVAFGASMATLTGTSTVSNTGIVNSGIAGRFAVSGTQYLNLGTDDANSFTLTFNVPQVAFGFYGTDIGEFNGQLALSFDGGAGVNVAHTVGGANGSGLYFGIIDVDNPFSTITFSSGSTSDAFGFDDFTIGTRDQVIETPAPGMLALFGLGLAVLGGLGRRKRLT